eukprot:1159509-Pelagomonas_calceolata.AAC.14
MEVRRVGCPELHAPCQQALILCLHGVMLSCAVRSKDLGSLRAVCISFFLCACKPRVLSTCMG